MEGDIKTDLQTERKRQTDRQTWMERKRELEGGITTDSQAERESRQTDRDEQEKRAGGRHKDRLTGRQAERER